MARIRIAGEVRYDSGISSSLDDLHRVGVRTGGDRVLPRLVLGLLQDGLPAAGAQVEDPVHVAADRGDGGADRVSCVEVVRADDLADPGDAVGDKDTAAADGDERPRVLGRLDPVNRVAERDVGGAGGVLEKVAVAREP